MFKNVILYALKLNLFSMTVLPLFNKSRSANLFVFYAGYFVLHRNDIEYFTKNDNEFISQHFFFTIYCSDECVNPHTNKLYSVCCYKRLWNSLSGALCEATVGPQEKMSHDSLHRITQSTTLPTLGEFIIYTVVLWIE